MAHGGGHHGGGSGFRILDPHFKAFVLRWLKWLLIFLFVCFICFLLGWCSHPSRQTSENSFGRTSSSSEAVADKTAGVDCAAFSTVRYGDCDFDAQGTKKIGNLAGGPGLTFCYSEAPGPDKRWTRWRWDDDVRSNNPTDHWKLWPLEEERVVKYQRFTANGNNRVSLRYWISSDPECKLGPGETAPTPTPSPTESADLLTNTT